MHSAPDDLAGTVDNLIRFGVIEAVQAGRATVKCGEITSPPLKWLTLAGGWKFWCQPTPSEQVTLLCPSGDIAGGVILRGLTSDNFPDGPDSLIAILTAPDGATFSYDPEAHALNITLPAGKITLTAPDGLDLTGDVKITGKLETTSDIKGGGKIEAASDLQVGGDLDVTGDSVLGEGAVEQVKLASGAVSTKVKAK